MTTAHPLDPFTPRARPADRRLLGWLPDGTPHYAPVGRVLVDGDHVCCHHCGRWFLSVASHLAANGWTKDAYVLAFGLEQRVALAGPATRARRAAAMRRRQRSEPAIRDAQRAAGERARTGHLTAQAAAAARGRAHSSQRRVKTMAALDRVRPAVRAAANVRRGERHIAAVAFTAAARAGFDDFQAYVLDRLAAGRSLAAISREAGLHKDWVGRHLPRMSPIAAARPALDRRDYAWRDVLAHLGFDDVCDYLTTRHVQQHRTVNAIATESGFSRAAVESALARHGINRTAHAAKRHAAHQRDRATALRLGFATIADYVTDRRAAGLTWTSMANEVGLPTTTLRRHGQPCVRSSSSR